MHIWFRDPRPPCYKQLLLVCWAAVFVFLNNGIAAQQVSLTNWEDAKFLIPLCISYDTDFQLTRNENAGENPSVRAFTGLSASDLRKLSRACRSIANAMLQIGSEARGERDLSNNGPLPSNRVSHYNQRFHAELLRAAASLLVDLTPTGQKALLTKLQTLRSATVGRRLAAGASQD